MKSKKVITMIVLSPFILASVALVYNLVVYGDVKRPNEQIIVEEIEATDNSTADNPINEDKKNLLEYELLGYKETRSVIGDMLVIGVIANREESKAVADQVLKHFKQTYELESMEVYLYPEGHVLNTLENMYQGAHTSITIEKDKDGNWIYSAWDEKNEVVYEAGTLE